MNKTGVLVFVDIAHFTYVYTYDTIWKSESRRVLMSIQYKMNVLSELKSAGYSTYRIRKERIFGEATVQMFRDKQIVSWLNINTVCRLLNCQVGDIVEYVKDEPVSDSMPPGNAGASDSKNQQ